ncbi:carboxy terminal-processing peptidase [Chitinophaga sp. Hz27]|uniref:carboxy terminal-processing peptidase n=1 Tax=Chitinophaga sp. Hz27 TaxID=3347169 RepID=UPI0035DE4E24
MKIFERNKWLLLMGATLTGISAHAQIPSNQAELPAFRKGTVAATIAKVKKMHFQPRAIDNAYSEAVWSSFMQALDINRNVFLQKDLDSLAKYKQSIDEDFNDGQTAFFDATVTIYNQRLKECNDLYKKLLANPFDYTIKESVILNRKKLPAPATLQEREDIWRKRLKYTTLSNYQELLAATGKSAEQTSRMDSALEIKAREKTRKMNDLFFKKALAANYSNELFTQYMSVAMIEIDPHTYFAGPKDDKLNQQLNKMYYGLGMELGLKDADYFVKRLLPGGAAFKSGVVKENDNILAISDDKGQMQNVSGLESTDVSNMIRGEKDTDVRLMLQQPGETARTVTVKREQVNDVENRAKSAIIEQHGKKFGYIYLPIFYMDQSGGQGNGSAADVLKEVAKLKEQEVDGMIMDLRGNGGGALDQVVKMSVAFLPGGPVSWLRSKDKIDSYAMSSCNALYEGPLTVMIDENSASASEIFAAVMQDRNRAIIVGPSSSFGKGTAQQTLNVGRMGDPALGTKDVNYGNMRLTVEKFYRVTGNATQLKGVTPDVVMQNRISFQAIMEKDYPSALAFDSVMLTSFERLSFPFNYDKIVAQARERVKQNTAFKNIENYSQQLNSLPDQPMSLAYTAFCEQYKLMNKYNKEILANRELSTPNWLNVSPALYRNLNPAFKSPMNEVSKGYSDMLERLKKDVYLAETLNILTDMVNESKK